MSSHESNQHPHSYRGIARAFVALANCCVASYSQTCIQARAESSLVASMLVSERLSLGLVNLPADPTDFEQSTRGIAIKRYLV